MALAVVDSLVYPLVAFLVALDITSIGGYVGLLFAVTGKGPDSVTYLIPLWIIMMVPLFVFCYTSCRYKLPSILLLVCSATTLSVIGSIAHSRGLKSADMPIAIVVYTVASIVTLIMTIRNAQNQV